MRYAYSQNNLKCRFPQHKLELICPIKRCSVHILNSLNTRVYDSIVLEVLAKRKMARDKQPFKQYTAHSKNELQSQLLASTEYNKWIANKRPRNSSALFSVATACGVTLVCILAVYIRLGSSVVQPASVDEVLQLLRQTQVGLSTLLFPTVNSGGVLTATGSKTTTSMQNENNQLAEQQQAMEDQLTFARYQIEALKSQLSTSQPSQKQTEQVQTTTSTRDTPLHVLQQLYTNRTGSRYIYSASNFEISTISTILCHASANTVLLHNFQGRRCCLLLVATDR